MRRRVSAGVEGLGNLPGAGAGRGNEGIDQSRFAHAGLTDENACLPGKLRSQCVDLAQCRQVQDRVAKAGERRQRGFCFRQSLDKVTLVEDDQRLDVLAFGGDQTARNEFV